MNDLSDLSKLLNEEELAELAPMLQRLDLLEGREAKQKDFMNFVKHVWPNFIEGAHHKIYAEKLQAVAEGRLKRLIINMPPRHALDIKEKILTTFGWKTIETLQVGDYVYGSDGRPTRVTGKSEIFKNKKLHRAITTDGASVVCDGEHLWTVRVRTEDTPSSYKTVSTDHLRDAEYRHGPYLPLFPPISGQEAEFDVHPYVLGAWLGDGSSSSGTMSAHPDDACFIRKRFEDCGVETTDLSWEMTFGTKGLMVKLREIGVLNNKHIPEKYLFASPDQRLALLQGLIDTDGDVTKQGKVTFNSSNRLLADQVCFLVRSFGLRARVTERDTGHFGKYKSNPSYRVMFKMAGAASLPRKAVRCRDLQSNRARSIRFEDCGVGDTQCIRVENEDGLFLAGEGLVITHNTKSEFASYLFPAWLMGRDPTKKIIQATHTAELAVGFGRKVKGLIESEEFREVFPDVKLAADAKASGRWSTNKRGEYYAVGVGGALAGRGADLAIIDDPISEQMALSPSELDKVYEWYTSGPRQRLQPGGAIIIVMTRWSIRDLTAKVLAKQSDKGADQWEVVEFPAIMPSGNPLWPEYWSLDELESVKASIPMGKWNAQYMQNPTAEEGAIIKREWWKIWEKKDPPPCSYIIQSYDTAFSTSERADMSAITTWGVFEPDDDSIGIILLDAMRGRWEFPELKATARELYEIYQPDMVLIEQKASGAPLTQELRRMGIPVTPFTPSRGADKMTRMNACAPVFESGLVWAPESSFADEVIEECAAFPNGEFDDLADTMTQAILRFRQGGFIMAPSDYRDDEAEYFQRRRREYY